MERNGQQRLILLGGSGGGGGSSSWGGITGTLSNQTDLQSALDALQTQITAIVPGYIAVANFAALPAAASHSGETYFCSAAQGVIWVNRKPAGLYTSNGVSWAYDADQTDAYLAGLTPSNGQLPVGNGTNFVTQTVGGDATLAADGTLTIGSKKITYAKIQDVSATSRILGRITAGSGVTEELTAANVKTILALTSSDVSLGSVTNDAQTKAAIVPNTAPAAGDLLFGNAGGTAYAKAALSGDATVTSAGVLTLKNSGVTANAYTAANITVDAQGRVTAAANGTAGLGYALCASTGSTASPLDATIYYFGCVGRPMTSTEGNAKHYIPKAGTIKVIELWWFASTTAGSNESITWSFRLNGTTDTTIASLGDTNATKRFSNTALSITVAQGDYFEMKMSAVTWATNPTGVHAGYTVYIE